MLSKTNRISFNRLLRTNKFMYQVVIYYSISTEHVNDTSHIQSYTTITTIHDAIMSTKRTKVILQLNVIIYPSGRMFIHIVSEVRSRYTSERIEKFSLSVVAEINRYPMLPRELLRIGVGNEYSRFSDISRYFVGSEYAQEFFAAFSSKNISDLYGVHLQFL